MAGSSLGTEILQFALNTLIVAVGWVVVHGLTAKRDREKSRREMICEAADLLGAATGRIFVAATGYHTSERDRVAETKLKVDLQDLSNSVRSLSMLSSDLQTLSTCRTVSRSFWRAITAEHFEDEHESPLRPGSPQLELIAQQSLFLKQSFLNLKYAQWPTNPRS